MGGNFLACLGSGAAFLGPGSIAKRFLDPPKA